MSVRHTHTIKAKRFSDNYLTQQASKATIFTKAYTIKFSRLLCIKKENKKKNIDINTI